MRIFLWLLVLAALLLWPGFVAVPKGAWALAWFCFLIVWLAGGVYVVLTRVFWQIGARRVAKWQAKHCDALNARDR